MKFLEPAGKDFIDELVYRFLLTRGDSLGGRMRNLGGILGEQKLSRALISTLSVEGSHWLHSKSRKWIQADSNDIELDLKGISWKYHRKNRTLIYNLSVPKRTLIYVCLTNKEINLILRSSPAITLPLPILPWGS